MNAHKKAIYVLSRTEDFRKLVHRIAEKAPMAVIRAYEDLTGEVLTDKRYAEVKRHCKEGNKIAAIKAYREIVGCDLRTAKEVVERDFWRGPFRPIFSSPE